MLRPRGFICLLISFLLLAIWIILTPAAEAAVYIDIANHWAKADIEFVSGQGIIAGYSDNTFRPGQNVTRAEYMAMINRTFKLTAAVPNTFSDVNAGDWFADDIGKAMAAGYVSGYSDGTIRPGQSITRQEAAVMIAKILGIASGAQGSVSRYKDQNSIDSWSRDAVAAVVARGYMGGYPDNTFRPKSFIKRAEAAVVMRAVYSSRLTVSTPVEPVTPVRNGETYDEPGTFGPASGTERISGDVSIGASGVILRNSLVTGDLVIGSSVGDGTVRLSNVTVQGSMTVEGGGSHSVVLENCSIADLIVDKDGVRILTTGSTNINNTRLQGEAILEESSLSGNGFQRVLISSSTGRGDDVELNGSFSSVSVSAPVDIALSTGSRITNLTLNAAASVTGSGSITTAYINAAGVSIAQTPDDIVIKDNITSNIGGRIVSGSDTSNIKAPVFSSGYPKTANLNSTYFDMLIKTNKSGHAYYIVLPNNDKTPSSKQVRNGENGYGNSVSRRGEVRLNANSEASIRVSNLTAGTPYDVWVVAEDDYSNLQSSATRLDVTPQVHDDTPPQLYSGYPRRFQITATSMEFLLKINEDGRAYYLVLPSSAAVPRVSQVQAGANPSGARVPDSMRGVIDMAEDTQASVVVTDLSSGTSYTLYVVVEDDNDNLQDDIEMLNFRTEYSSGGSLAFETSSVIVAENVSTGSIVLTVTRKGGNSGAASVYYATADSSAYSGSDYALTNGILTWASGEAASKMITIPIINDSLIENAEAFTVTLSNASGATLGSPSYVMITINSEDMGWSLAVQANPGNGGTVTGSGIYAAGAIVPVTATPLAGYTFTGWTSGGAVLSASIGYNYTMPSAVATLVANFTPAALYQLTVQSNGAGGTVTGSGSYAAGATVPVTAVPASGYALMNWTAGSSVVSTSASFNYTMPGAATTLTANFSAVYVLNVQVDGAGGGTVSPGGNYAEGAAVTVSASPAAGYVFSEWMEGGTAISNSSTLSYTMPGHDATLTARFKRVYTVNLSVNPAGYGTVSGAGTYNEGESVTVEATAAAGYKFDNWTLGGSAVSTDSSYIFPAANCDLTANFSTL
ncbi:MAG: InlB B-repeat-containing protein [Deltaproteobacteria bacterium]